MPNLFNQPIHLSLGAPALARPDFTGMDWYAGYMDRHADDGIEGRLVSMSAFTPERVSREIHLKVAKSRHLRHGRDDHPTGTG
jgi:hypothetical protein